MDAVGPNNMFQYENGFRKISQSQKKRNSQAKGVVGRPSRQLQKVRKAAPSPVCCLRMFTTVEHMVR